VLHADPEGDCRRECAEYVCYARQGKAAGEVAFCFRFTDTFCHDESNDYCHPDMGCRSGPCEFFLEGGKKKVIQLQYCDPSKCTLTCPNSLPQKKPTRPRMRGRELRRDRDNGSDLLHALQRRIQVTRW
jgi:hypothetical protein